MFARAGGAAAPHGSPPKGSGHVPYDVLVGALRALPNPPFVISNSLGVAVMSGGTVLSGEAPSQRVSLPMGHSLAIFDAAPRPEADPAFDTTSSLVHIDDLPFPAWKACDTSFITNTAWKQTTGFGSIGEWIRAIHPDDAAAAADFMASAARRSLIDATYRVRVASGELLHFNIKAQPVFGLTRGVGPPPIAYMVGISNNITGHKAAEADSAARRHVLETVIEAIPVCIVMISAPHGDLILANWLACDYYFNSAPPSVQCPEHGLRNAASGDRDRVQGVPPPEMCCVRHCTSHFRHFHGSVKGPPVMPSEEPVMRSMLRGEHIINEVFAFVHAGTGKSGFVRYTSIPVTDAAGAVTSVICLWADVTVEMAAEAQLLELRSSKETMRHKSEFVANMSHELRTPINGVIGIAGLLAVSEPLSSDQRGLINTVIESGRLLLTVVNDILDFAKTDAGRLVLERIPVDLRRVLSDAVLLVRPTADNLSVKLSTTVRDDVPQFVRGDPVRFKQIVLNLIGNAIKFTGAASRAGRVSAMVSVVHEPSEGKEADPSSSAASSGGARRLRVEVSDNGPGVPPEVIPHLFMPFSQADASTTRRFGGTGLGLSISKGLVLLMGGDIGVKATQSPGGGEVPAGGCGGATFFFEVPLLTIPEEEVEAAHAAAVLDANALAVALGAGLPPRGGGHGGPNLLAGGAEIHSPRPPAAVRNARVLIVDDNRVNLLIVERVVRRLHMVPVLASDGAMALDAVRRSGEVGGSPFDLILMDCQMPVMDGYAAISAIRALSPRLAEVPILALTASAMPDDVKHCLDAGMDAHIPKPIEVDALCSSIRDWLPGELAGNGRYRHVQACASGRSATDATSVWNAGPVAAAPRYLDPALPSDHPGSGPLAALPEVSWRHTR